MNIAIGNTVHKTKNPWSWLQKLAGNWRTRSVRQLRLCETLPLGEKRFLAVVQFEQQKFLIGTAGNSVALLTALEESAMPKISADNFSAEHTPEQIGQE